MRVEALLVVSLCGTPGQLPREGSEAGIRVCKREESLKRPRHQQ